MEGGDWVEGDCEEGVWMNWAREEGVWADLFLATSLEDIITLSGTFITG